MLCCVNADGGHAGAIERNAVAQTDIVEVIHGRLDGEPLAMV